MRQTLPILASALALAACAADEPPAAPAPVPPMADGGDCRAEAAMPLIGQKAGDETGRRALELTGARTLRWGPPNAAFTRDYRTDRVNVMYDEAMSITQITCG